MSNIILENSTVVIRSMDAKSSYILKVCGDQKLGKSRISLKELAGKPYGSVFELQNRTLKLVDCSDKGLEYYVEDDMTESQTSQLRGNNSVYVDSNTAQKLKDTDIQKLRESGYTGEKIIQSLIDNSDTFASKTDFAQEKWIKRKEKKYRKTYRVLKCNPFNICEASFDKNKEKICNLRPDSLAQVLSQSGVHSGSRVLVVESMVGLIVGSLAYRMRGMGRILAVYGSQQPHFDMAHSFNLDQACTAIIQVPFHLPVLCSLSHCLCSACARDGGRSCGGGHPGGRVHWRGRSLAATPSRRSSGGNGR